MTNDNTPKMNAEFENMTAALALAREQLHEMERDVANMEQRLRLARGTQNPDQLAGAVAAARALTLVPAPTELETNATPEPTPVLEPTNTPTVTPAADLRTRICQTIRMKSMTTTQIATAVHASSKSVTNKLEELREEGLVYNLGNEDFPVWTYRIGDDTTTAELTEQVRRLISERPMMMRELIAATGARMSRVSGALVYLQRSEPGIRNQGNARVAIWFLVTGGKAAALPIRRLRRGRRSRSE